ncbi:hypothetical protein GF314_12870 [bacterium]|nr:hypothetical protein [bacterium]
MILATHQPIFLPWPGFFAKGRHADVLVLLDRVQFPRGRTWLTRNRLKNETGELWLTVPVWRTGRGLQRIDQVELAEERGWRAGHLRGIRQNYAHAPYLADWWPALAAIYARRQGTLLAFNLELIRLLWTALGCRARLVLQSETGIEGRGTDLQARLGRHLGADRLALLPGVEKHLDEVALRHAGLEPLRLNYRPITYPQLWGSEVQNLSALDLLLNCGPRARAIIDRGVVTPSPAGPRSPAR